MRAFIHGVSLKTETEPPPPVPGSRYELPSATMLTRVVISARQRVIREYHRGYIRASSSYVSSNKPECGPSK